MVYLYAFLIPGLICLAGQVILDNTKFTPGHVTSLFTVVGVILSFLKLYDKIIDLCGAGITVMIINYGALLYKGCYYGITHFGIIGLFTNMFKYASSILTLTIICGFVLALVLKPKN